VVFVCPVSGKDLASARPQTRLLAASSAEQGALKIGAVLGFDQMA
jgi:hypothetical protein